MFSVCQVNKVHCSGRNAEKASNSSLQTLQGELLRSKSIPLAVTTQLSYMIIIHLSLSTRSRAYLSLGVILSFRTGNDM